MATACWLFFGTAGVDVLLEGIVDGDLDVRNGQIRILAAAIEQRQELVTAVQQLADPLKLSADSL